ncbi:hypothetical protein B0H14DRAFT_3859321 [Mycena olivaceomarginata]|nr:hypothetical protein B0H14DRAFT_3859321 [Mycena olivaceomarginata]
MPTELISLILTLTLPPFATSDGLSSIQEGPWLLSAVCSRWRAIALSQPCLWATICLDFTCEDWQSPSFELLQSRLEAHLERSQQVPLHITFRAFWHEALCRERELRVLYLLALHCDRWETISFTGSAMLYYHLDSIRGNLSLLRAIDIRAAGGLHKSGALRRGPPPRCRPALLPITPIQRKQLLGEPTPMSCALPHPIWSTASCTSSAPPAPSESPILLPHLRRLSVSSTDLLELLDTPALEELYSYHSVDYPAFFGACVPQLRKLFVAEIPSADHLERILRATPPTVAELCLYLPVQFASHLSAILGVGSRPPKRDEDGHGVPASTLALRALSLCFVPDSDRSSAPAPVDQDALMGFVESQLGSLRSLKLYGGGVPLLLPLMERLRVVRFPSSGALYANMVPKDFRLCNLDPDPYIPHAYL